MNKMLAAPLLAGAVMFGPTATAIAQEARTTPDAATSSSTADDDDGDSGKVGLLGLLGLAGLAGLAGLKRRERTVSRYESVPGSTR